MFGVLFFVQCIVRMFAICKINNYIIKKQLYRWKKSAERGKLKARANERNVKLALAFHSECSRGSSARSAVKGENEVSILPTAVGARRLPLLSPAGQNLLVLLWGAKAPVVANIAHSQCPLGGWRNSPTCLRGSPCRARGIAFIFRYFRPRSTPCCSIRGTVAHTPSSRQEVLACRRRQGGAIRMQGFRTSHRWRVPLSQNRLLP